MESQGAGSKSLRVAATKNNTWADIYIYIDKFTGFGWQNCKQDRHPHEHLLAYFIYRLITRALLRVNHSKKYLLLVSRFAESEARASLSWLGAACRAGASSRLSGRHRAEMKIFWQYKDSKECCFFCIWNELSRQETPNSVLEGVYVLLNQILTHNLWARRPAEHLLATLVQDPLLDLLVRHLWKISIYNISKQDLQRYLWTSWQEIHKRSLYRSSLLDRTYTRSPDIPGPPRSLHRSSLQDLFTRPMRDLFTRALYKVSSQDHHVWHLYTRSPARSRHEIPTKDLYERSLWQELLTRSLRKTSIRQGPYEMFQLSTRSLRSLHSSSLQDLFTRPLWEISIQELSTTFMRVSTRSLRKTSMRDTRSRHKTPMRDLYTRALYKVSSQAPNDVAMQDLLISLDLLGLFTGALYRISSQDIYERSLYKSSLRSPDIPGPPRSLHSSSLQDLFTRPINERSLYKSALQDPFTRPLWEISIQELSTRSPHKTTMRDLVTRALYKISSQGPHMRHFYARSPGIPRPPGSLHRSSLQDLFTRPIYERSLNKSSLQDLHTRPLWEISIQELSTRSLHRTPYETSLYKIPWYPWTS